jgi:ProP effector
MPPEGDDSAPQSLPLVADGVPESAPAAAPAEEASTDAAAAQPSADSADPVDPVDAAEPAEPGDAGETGETAEPADAAARPAQEDCGPQLRKLYPALFSNPPKPIKLRIQADIQARSPGLFTKPQLSAFLRRYTGSHAYLNALVKATHRYDLDGAPGDELSDEHRVAATEELARRRANTQARIALENEQRANRATLLREFEANTLPAAEFATSRNVPEGELEPLLARARKEALELPPAPAFNRDRRGPNPNANRGPRPEGQRNARPPRDAQVAAPADGAAPQGEAPGTPRPPRPPRTDRPQGPRTDAPRTDRPQGPRTDAPRTDRPQGPRTDAPRTDRPQGARTDRPQGPRGDRPPGPRSDAPQADRPRGPLDAPRGPRPDGPRNGPRPDSRGPRADGPRDPNNGPRRSPSAAPGRFAFLAPERRVVACHAHGDGAGVQRAQLAEEEVVGEGGIASRRCAA